MWHNSLAVVLPDIFKRCGDVLHKFRSSRANTGLLTALCRTWHCLFYGNPLVGDGLSLKGLSALDAHYTTSLSAQSVTHVMITQRRAHAKQLLPFRVNTGEGICQRGHFSVSIFKRFYLSRVILSMGTNVHIEVYNDRHPRKQVHARVDVSTRQLHAALRRQG